MSVLVGMYYHLMFQILPLCMHSSTLNLTDSHMDCLRGCLVTLSVLVVRIALLEYSKIHEKALKFVSL